MMLTFGFTKSNFEFTVWQLYERIVGYTNESDIANSKWEMMNDVHIWIYEFEFRIFNLAGIRTNRRVHERIRYCEFEMGNDE